MSPGSTRNLLTSTRHALIRIQRVERLTRLAEETHHFTLEAGSSKVVDFRLLVVVVVVVIGSELYVLACTRRRPVTVQPKISSRYPIFSQEEVITKDHALTRLTQTKHTPSHPQPSNFPLQVPPSQSLLHGGPLRPHLSPGSRMLGRRCVRGGDTRPRSGGVGRV